MHPRRRESSLMREANQEEEEEVADFDEQQDVDMAGELHGTIKELSFLSLQDLRKT